MLDEVSFTPAWDVYLDPTHGGNGGQRAAGHYVRIAKGPCHGCRLRQKCGTDLLACDAFKIFVGSNKLRKPSTPNRVIYDALFSGQEDDE